MCNLDKPLFQCTLGDFAEAIAEVLRGAPPPKVQKNEFSEYPKGIKGIQRIFNCGDYTARNILQSGVIDKAIIRLGARTFVTDPVEARKLYTINQNK